LLEPFLILSGDIWETHPSLFDTEPYPALSQMTSAEQGKLGNGKLGFAR
jgi:hypothetical protein